MCVLQTPESDRNLYWPLDNGDSSMAILHGAAHCHVVRVMHSFSITSTIWTEEVSRCCRETHTADIFIRSVCRHPIHRFQSLYYFVYFIPIFLLDFEYPFILTKAWYLLCEFSRAHCYTTAEFANAESRQLCNDYTRRLRNVSVCPVFSKEVSYSEEILLPHMSHGSGHFRSIRTY